MPRPKDEIEIAERLFGPKLAEELRRRRAAALPARVEIDPVTGRRSYSMSDE